MQQKGIDVRKRDVDERAVVESALRLFLQKDMELVTMEEIAADAGIGVATLYRWFGTKKALLLRAGILLWQRAGEHLEALTAEKQYQALTGFAQIRALMEHALDAFREQPGFPRFLNRLDACLAREPASQTDLMAYEQAILCLQTPVRKACIKGIQDGTIREDVDFARIYYTGTHALLALAQKLLLTGELLPSDAMVSGEEQLNTLCGMILQTIQNKEAAYEEAYHG